MHRYFAVLIWTPVRRGPINGIEGDTLQAGEWGASGLDVMY